ncbi:hypothetical protein HJFPF1_03263 [Paramyrothecium foliicola]|nr:hypothetical protein HJFPF1_03263 [Paramyrothecium foliicola]
MVHATGHGSNYRSLMLTRHHSNESRQGSSRTWYRHSAIKIQSRERISIPKRIHHAKHTTFQKHSKCLLQFNLWVGAKVLKEASPPLDNSRISAFTCGDNLWPARVYSPWVDSAMDCRGLEAPFEAPSIPSPLDASDSFLGQMDKLNIMSKLTPAPALPRDFRARSTSSEYPLSGTSPQSAQSPLSLIPVCHLSISDLSQFGKDNECLSNLCSSSSSAQSGSENADTSTYAAIADAAAVITEWQGERVISPSSTEQATITNQGLCITQQPEHGEHGKQETPTDSGYTTERVSTSTQGGKCQFDGAADANRLRSPDAGSMAQPIRSASQAPRQSKRKASDFSLRSIKDSFTKRPRLTLQKLAATVYEQGSKRIRQAKHQWRRQADQERRDFQAWKAARRRDHPANVLMGKSEGGFGTFCLERSRFEHEPWWHEGVCRYQAPAWMFPRNPLG